jgi:hypothetical protein
MRRLLPITLAFLTGCLVATVGPSLAADRADDFILTVDIDSTNGSLKRTLSITQHHELVTSQWSAERAAAATSLASWLSWMSTNAQPAHAWISGMTATQQEGMRQALLKGS